jgi:addiction module HigA family antidote
VSRKTINEIVNGKRGITAEMALRLGMFTRTSPEMWLNLQNAVDLWDAYNSPGLCLEECIQAYG